MKNLVHKSFARLLLAGVISAGTPLTMSTLNAQEEEGTAEVTVVVNEEREGDSKLWLGIMLKPIEGDLARYLGSEEGILVDSVYEKSPADKGGLKEGDILIRIGGDEVGAPGELLALMGDVEEGQKLKIKVMRQGKEQDIIVVPEARPEAVENEVREIEEILHSNLENSDEIRAILKKVQDGDGEGVNVFSFGGPAFRWTTDGDMSGNLNLNIKKNVNGEDIEVKVQKDDEEPMVVVVTKDGETKEFTVDDLEDLPEEVAKMVKPLMDGKGAMRVRSLKMMPNLPKRIRALNLELDEEGLSDKIRDMAKQYRVEVLSEVEEDGEEVESLREVVEALKKEVEQLKAELKKRD